MFLLCETTKTNKRKHRQLLNYSSPFRWKLLRSVRPTAADKIETSAQDPTTLGTAAINTLSWFNVVFAYRDRGSRLHILLWVFCRDERIYVFQIQIQWKNFISKSNPNPSTTYCSNSKSYHCY